MLSESLIESGSFRGIDGAGEQNRARETSFEVLEHGRSRGRRVADRSGEGPKDLQQSLGRLGTPRLLGRGRGGLLRRALDSQGGKQRASLLERLPPARRRVLDPRFDGFLDERTRRLPAEEARKVGFDEPFLGEKGAVGERDREPIGKVLVGDSLDFSLRGGERCADFLGGFVHEKLVAAGHENRLTQSRSPFSDSSMQSRQYGVQGTASRRFSISGLEQWVHVP